MSGRRLQATCSAVNCSNRFKKGSGIIFHPFPLNNEELLKKWAIAMRRAKFTPTKAHYLCSTHFEDKCYTSTSNGRRILNSSAVPTIFNFPLKRPIRIPTSSSRGSNSSSDGPPIYAAVPFVISPPLPQSHVNPVRRAFLKDHCYSLPGLQKLKRRLDESENGASITRNNSLALSDAEQILGTALQERRIILNGMETIIESDVSSTIETVETTVPTPPTPQQSNPIQEHIDACVMKAVTPLEQQLLHMQEVVSALTTQINHQQRSQRGQRKAADGVGPSGKDTFDWLSLLPTQPPGSLPEDEHEIQVLATRLAVSFSELPAEAVAEQYNIHYVLTQFAAWPVLPTPQRLATYRTARIMYNAITKGWASAIQQEQEAVVRVPVQVQYNQNKRSSPRSVFVAHGKRAGTR